jgi:two-component system, sensor histidine kinase
VLDTGRGIAQEMLHRIFELFTQADVTLDRAEGGIGIGLTLVRKLVELHGGTVEARSDGRGRGSEFIVRIPAITPAERTAPAEAERREAPGAQTSKRIVVVEDNADVRTLLRVELQRLGHEVHVAAEGPEGLEKILEQLPDVALVDIGLPTLDGYEIARRVRAAIGDGIHLIALSGYGQTEDRNRALEAGFNIHLTKPAGIMELERVLTGT